VKIADFYRIGLSRLVYLFGNQGVWIWHVIMGLDSRSVHDAYIRKSIGKERTFMEDEGDSNIVLSKIHEINTHIHSLLEKQRYRYNTITLKIRLSGFITFTRSKTMKTPLRDSVKAEKELDTMFDIFSHNSAHCTNRKIRLIGVRFSHLEHDTIYVQSQITDFI
jgi:DNA polymerase-4